MSECRERAGSCLLHLRNKSSGPRQLGLIVPICGTLRTFAASARSPLRLIKSPCRRAGSGHSPQLREARVREEQAAIHRPFDHCVHAALCIEVSNAQIVAFANYDRRRRYINLPGPLLPSIRHCDAASRLSHCSHSCIMQHFVGMNDDTRDFAVIADVPCLASPKNKITTGSHD